MKRISVIIINLVALVVILGVLNVYFYTSMQSQITTLNTEKTSLQSQVTTLLAQKNSLNTTYQHYLSTHSYTDTQYNLLKAPKLIVMDLSVTDYHPALQDPYLQVSGYVSNVGNTTAYNARLHVITYRSGLQAIDTYISLGTLAGESWVSVNSAIVYTGTALTSWIVTPEWTSS